MVERNPIFKAKTDNQMIAYIEDTAVFDLMEQVAVDNVAVSVATIKPNEDAVSEAPLSSDAERALEMI
jgi:hypothetical protein